MPSLPMKAARSIPGALFEIADMSLSMVAVDGFRLAFRREKLEKLEGGAFSFVCPGSALSEDQEHLAAIRRIW